MTVRTRFAPSPTGSLHVGGARTALYCFLYARHHEGRFLLRIEDTDQARSTDEAAAGIVRDLTWLGIEWDEGPGKPSDVGPFFQSQRRDLYDGYLRQLVDDGKAYEAWDSTEELVAQREAASKAKENFRYRRRTWTDDELASFRAEGRVPVLRLQGPDHDVHVHDDVLGRVSLTADDLDDLVIRKADGWPTFHFAVVVDDHHMGVSLVLRGQEHLMNTHKHVTIYEALGWDPPRYAHVPLIFNPGGSKMSKRDKAKAARAAARAVAAGREGWAWLAEATGLDEAMLTRFMKKKHDRVDVAEAIAAVLHVDLPMIEVQDFRKAGYLPEALLNYLALLGWSPGEDREILPMDDLVASFDLDRVNKTAARFDPDKLAWMNSEYIKAASLDRLLDVQDAYLEVQPQSVMRGVARDRRRAFLELYQPRIQTLADLDAQARFFFVRPTSYDDKAVQKFLVKQDGLARLPDLEAALRAVPAWDAATLTATLEGFAAAQDLKMGRVAQPIRVAVSGTSVSPPIGETLELLGQDEACARLLACVRAHASN